VYSGYLLLLLFALIAEFSRPRDDLVGT
jgi:hypothetical protein